MSGKISGKLIQGIGTNKGEYPSRNGGKHLKEYQLWVDMLKRCGNKLHTKHLTYTGTTCSENFKSYTFFYEWCQEQVGFNLRDEKHRVWCLDKDILIKGNKLYGEDTCVFIPQRLNKLLTKADKNRGDYFIGVARPRGCRFVANCVKDNINIRIGTYDTEQEAFEAYKLFKEALIKEVANEYRTQLDPRAYQALLNYTVEITD